jgi:hypothetical protein
MRREIPLGTALVILIVAVVIIVGVLFWRYKRQTAPPPLPPGGEPMAYPPGKAPAGEGTTTP